MNFPIEVKEVNSDSEASKSDASTMKKPESVQTPKPIKSKLYPSKFAKKYHFVEYYLKNTQNDEGVSSLLLDNDKKKLKRKDSLSHLLS